MPELSKHIIAIGGGGIGRNKGEEALCRYIISQARTKTPKALFIGTATGEDPYYTSSAYKRFNAQGVLTNHLSLFTRTPKDVEGFVLEHDIIYVGGGNTKSMLAVWKEWGVDKALAKAYDEGVVLCGVSAGAICWFEQGLTDSWEIDLNVIPCMGFLKGSMAPHYDSEEDRRPSFHKFLKKGKIMSGYAAEENVALHFVNGSLSKTITHQKGQKGYMLSTEIKGLEKVLKAEMLEY